jgi:hypothetical protein
LPGLLIAATATALLLKASSATGAASQIGHGHAAGQAAHKVLNFVSTDQAFPAIAHGKALSRIGESHAGKAALTCGPAAAEAALQAADTAPGGAVAKHPAAGSSARASVAQAAAGCRAAAGSAPKTTAA